MTENIEKKWQKKWENDKLFESDPNDKEKLFLTVHILFQMFMQDLKEWKVIMYCSQWHGM